MASLRERKKSEAKEKLLKTALEIFLRQGYEKTTVAQIAAQADIGMGTLYNYFPSKAHLFLETFTSFGHSAQTSDRVRDYLREPPGEPLEAIVTILDIYLEAIKDVPKELWQEFVFVFARTPSIDEQKKSIKEHIEQDYLFLEDLRLLFKLYQEKGRLDPHFNPQDGAECIYGICAVQFILYLYEKDLSFTEIREKLIRLFSLFFTPKLLRKAGDTDEFAD